MKVPGKIAPVLVGLMCCAAFSAEPSDTEQTKDLVRVAVVSVSKTSVFPAQTTSESSVAGIKIVYLVEALGNTPIQNFDLGHIGFTVDGKGVSRSKKSSDEGLIVASDYRKYDWKKLKKPAVSHPDRAVVYDFSIPYFQLPEGKIDLHVETGFNLSDSSFVFKNIVVDNS
jgi:hypothetical protein